MAYFTTDGKDRLEAKQVPERSLGSSIMRTKDTNLIVANWCGGDVGDNESGISMGEEDTRYAQPGHWIVKVADGFTIWSKVNFLATFKKVENVPKFKSRPVEIEAVQVNWANWNLVCELHDRHSEPHMTDTLKVLVYEIPFEEISDACGETDASGGYIAFKVTTAHGEEAVVRHGDWLVPEKEHGRFYPIKPDIFKEKYYPVNYVGQELTWEQFNDPDRPR